MSKDRMDNQQKKVSWPTDAYRRLSRSRQSANHEDQSQVYTTQQESSSICMDTESPITDFLQEIDAIRSMIDKIDELSQQVKTIHIEMLQLPTNPKLAQELDHKNEEIKTLAYDSSNRLKTMEQAIENRTDLDASNAHRRIKESQIFVLIRRFRDTMVQYNQETVSHRERCKKAIVRELELAGQRRSNDELEEMFENGISESLNFSILIDTQKAKECLSDLEARRLDILKLENCIKELHSMFRDLAMLVANQGEMIDCIEYNVEKAMDYVEVAAEDVHIADNYRKRAGKKKLVILITLITGVFLIFIIILIGYFTQRKLRGR